MSLLLALPGPGCHRPAGTTRTVTPTTPARAEPPERAVTTPTQPAPIATQPHAATPPVAHDVSLLHAHLNARRQEWEAAAPADMVAAFEAGIEEVRRSGITWRALNVGDKAPLFALPNVEGTEVRLQALLSRGPVVLVWYRGGWCPYCNLQLRAYQEVLPAIEALGGQLVAISPETPEHGLSTRERDGLAFEVLTDAGNRVARRFGIVYRVPAGVLRYFEGQLDLAAHNADASQELPLAAVYVVDRSGLIRYAHLSADYRERAEPAAILEALAQVERNP